MAAVTKKKVSTNTCRSSSYIPDDIALSILSKLPLKSLTRFTCVQKSWSLLLQNLNFMDMFRTNFFISKHPDDDEDTTRLLLKQTTRMIPIHDSLCILSGDSFEDRVRLDWPPPFLENDSDIDILGSSSVNGIFCLFNGYGNETVLWNPATEEFKIIPPSYEPYDNNYEPAGFCYDCIRDDYKVIRFAPCYQVFEGSWVWLPDKDCHLWESNELLDEVLEDDYEFWDGFKIDMYDEYWEIYSLRSNSWRKLDGVDLPDSWGSSTSRNVNLNGFCHWYNYRNNIVSFDFRNETFFTTTLPSDLGKQIELQEKQLLELNGSISLICNFKTKDFFDIWILGELGVKESWAKFFVVGPLTCSVMRPIGAGKKRFIFFRKKYDDELAWYDFSTQRISEIGAKGELLSLKIVTYKENLVPFREMINQ